MKFKIGEKVRVRNTGDTGVIKKILRYGSSFPYLVLLKGFGDYIPFHANSLEKIPEKEQGNDSNL